MSWLKAILGKKLLFKILLLLLVLTIATTLSWILLKKPAIAPARTPSIESIVPSEGMVGTSITIKGSGFTQKNDIAFTPLSTEGTSIGYFNNVPSSDTKTIRLTLPDAVGICATTRMKEDEACPEIAMLLPKDGIEISVVNKNGESNKVKFKILP